MPTMSRGLPEAHTPSLSSPLAVADYLGFLLFPGHFSPNIFWKPSLVCVWFSGGGVLLKCILTTLMGTQAPI